MTLAFLPLNLARRDRQYAVRLIRFIRADLLHKSTVCPRLVGHVSCAPFKRRLAADRLGSVGHGFPPVVLSASGRCPW